MIQYDGRPYWVSDEVKALMWNGSYANPSGHSLYFFASIPSMFYLFFYAKTRGKYAIGWNEYRDTKCFKVFYVTIIVLWVAFGAPSIFSRLYLGSHTIDQLIYGTLIGLTCFFYWTYVLREPLHQYSYKFLRRNCSGKEAITHIAIITGGILLIFAISIASYFIKTSIAEDPLEWREATVNKWGDPREVLNDPNVFAKRNLRYMFPPASMPASLIGAILYSYFCKTPINNFKIFPVWKAIWRMLVNGVIWAPLIILTQTPPTWPTVLYWLLSQFAITLGFAILVMSLTKYVCVKCNLIEPIEEESEANLEKQYSISDK